MSQAHPNGPSVIERLAAYASAESFAKLPEDTVRAARRAILDTIGVMLAGAREDTAVRARTLIAHRRGHEEATVAGTALRASMEDAALVNGVAAHALDYDDVQASLSGHPSVPVLPAALALAERRQASGAALLTAFVVGVEIESKLGRAVNPAHYEAGWHCVDQAKGQPRNPLTDADLEVKFRDAAGRVLSADRVDALLAALQELETAADVRVVARLLSGKLQVTGEQ